MLFFTCLLTAGAATNNPPARWTTNWVTAAPQFRIVRRQIYNSEQSSLWEYTSIKVHALSSNGVIGSSFTSTEKRDYIYGDYVVVTNLPGTPPTRGKDVSFRAMRVGQLTNVAGVLKILDCGTPNRAQMVYSNGVPVRSLP